MKNLQFSKNFKSWTAALACVLFSVATVFAQNGVALKLRINNLKDFSKMMLDIMPSEKEINAHKPFSEQQKKTLLKIRKSFSEGGQMTDNTLTGKFLSIEKEIAQSENQLWGFNGEFILSVGAENGSQHGGSGGNTVLDKFRSCVRTCKMLNDNKSCEKLQTEEAQTACRELKRQNQRNCIANCSNTVD